MNSFINDCPHAPFARFDVGSPLAAQFNCNYSLIGLIGKHVVKCFADTSVSNEDGDHLDRLALEEVDDHRAKGEEERTFLGAITREVDCDVGEGLEGDNVEDG